MPYALPGTKRHDLDGRELSLIILLSLFIMVVEACPCLTAMEDRESPTWTRCFRTNAWGEVMAWEAAVKRGVAVKHKYCSCYVLAQIVKNHLKKGLWLVHLEAGPFPLFISSNDFPETPS